MAQDALERQSKMQFGCRGSKTTILEADETQISHWSEQVTEVIDNARVTFTRHHWYVWLAVLVRGDLSSLWMKLVGLTHSDGDKGRVPPLSKELWAEVWNCFVLKRMAC
jgi:hypothetical protein